VTHTTVVSLAVGVDFSLSASPSSQTLTQGQSTSYGIAVVPTGGFGSPVSLSAAGLPSGAGATFSPNPATSSSTMSVTTAPSTPAGTYSLTITGSSGGLVRTTTVTLMVGADFSLAASPSSRAVKRGQSTSYTVTIIGGPGFGDQVGLSVGALPSGVTATFSTNPTRTSSTLSVTASSSAKPGNSTLTITGAGTSGLTHTTSVMLQMKK
jgi:serine protease AprX